MLVTFLLGLMIGISLTAMVTDYLAWREHRAWCELVDRAIDIIKKQEEELMERGK